MDGVKQREHQVLAIAPTGKDARATREVLASAGIKATICADMAGLCRQLDSGAGAVLLTDESLKPEGSLAALAAALQRQPKWSDVPIVLLASGGADSPIAMQALRGLQNVLVLDRPVHLPTLVSAVRTVLRSRQRQYEIRDYLTERKRTEEELEKARAEAINEKKRLEAVMEALPVGVAITDSRGGTTRSNSMFDRLWGGTRPATDSINDYAAYQAYWVETGQPVLPDEWASAQAVQKGAAVLGQLMEIQGFDGVRRFVVNSGAPVLDAEGRIVGSAVAMQDITELRRAEKSQARLAAIVESSDDAIVSKDLNGVIQTWNAGAERLFGYRAEEIVGQPITLLLPPERIHEEGQILERVRSGQRVEHLETVRVTKDGRRIDVSVTASPIKDKDGRIIAASKLAHDITDRKRAEAALLEAKAAAEAASVAKSRFLANMSHELRTPMNAILGLIDVALPNTIHPTVRDCLQTAKGSAGLLLTLLNDLLDSAKIESGRFELESAPFSLRQMLDQITRVLAARASGKGLSFCCRVPDQTPDAVTGDRMRLQQVLLNLAGNAVKFTERGEVAISVEQSQISDAESEICNLTFAVRDTGIGIPPAVQEHLFRPFTQADTSTARRFGGTGLGLSISKSFVEMMDGRIWVESEPGKGSTFYFTVRLPLAKELPSDFEAPVAVTTVASAQLRILLAEDNPANQKLAAYILQDRGHLLDIAEDGQQAIDLSEQNHYDVILMDVEMPGMNGLEAAAAIRKREAGGPRVPIIAMTAHAMAGDRDRCLAHGMDGYLSKPIDAQEMIALIEGLAARGAPAVRASVAPTEPASPTSPAVFDPKTALKRCTGSRDVLARMAQCFVAEVRNLIPQMRAASEKGDFAEAGRLAHRLKGTIVYLGSESAEKAAIALEKFHEGGEKAEAEEAVRALEHECALLESALALHEGLSAIAPTPPGDSSTTVDASIFNLEEAIKRCFNRRAMFHAMVESFFEDMDKLFPQMRAAMERSDYAEVGHLGHRLKGTVNYLGAERAMEAALRVERFARAGAQLTDAAAAVNVLEQECVVLGRVLAAHRSTACLPQDK
ncbi:MAG: PAS domain S-box protein [Rhodopirellula sp.]|nr:PAS domain S-box protein [Rhodopirellula sp.]